MRYVLLLIIATLLCYACRSTNDAPDYLTCNNQEHALGIDDSTVRLGWQMNDTLRDAFQRSYQLQVSSTLEDLEQNKPDCWDSKQVQSSKSIDIEYKGVALRPCTRYYWRVRVWNGNNKVSEWSKPAFFETGLMNNWNKAQWIAKPNLGAPHRSVLLRYGFMLKEKITAARVYASALGSYQLFINGKKVSNDCFAPGYTDYNKRIQYQVYDVTNLVKEGGNAVGACLGSMWWGNGIEGSANSKLYGNGSLRFFMQLIVNYAEGKADTIVTNDQWKASYSAILSNNIYNGEYFDARLDEHGWNNTGFADKNWVNAQHYIQTKKNLVANAEPAICVMQKYSAAKIVKINNNEYVYDFGQNIAGVVQLTTKSLAGDTISMRYAELIHPDGTVAQENLRSAKATDTYIARGAPNGETYTPRFTYHGFRYVQVKGLRAKADSNTLVALALHNNVPTAGYFECSNKLINKIWKNVQQTLQSNLMSVPTHCAQRNERGATLLDAQLTAPTALFAFDMHRFYSKWMADIADGQDKTSGLVSTPSPSIASKRNQVGCADAIILIPWQMYTWYADTIILQRYYSNMKAWVEYMRKQSVNNSFVYSKNKDNVVEDWAAVVNSPSKQIGSLSYYQCTYLLAQIARVLKLDADAKQYQALANAIALAYNKNYYNNKTEQYEGKTQFANLMPLAYSIAPKEIHAKLAQTIANNIEARDNHLSTGYIGTAYLLPELSKQGYHELAYRLASQETYPSWGYMVKQGATTMWESWKTDKEMPAAMNSRNHIALASIGEWFWRYLAGINMLPEQPGFKQFLLAPMPTHDLQWVKAQYRSPYGSIKSEWKIENGSFCYMFTIPANSSAQVNIPILQSSLPTIYEGKATLFDGKQAKSNYPYARFISSSNTTVSFQFKSGSYKVWYTFNKK